MSNVNIDFLQGAGFDAYLKSDGVKALIESHTNATKERADSYITGESQGFNANVKLFSRWVGLVGTTDRATMVAESEQKALTKAVHG